MAPRIEETYTSKNESETSTTRLASQTEQQTVQEKEFDISTLKIVWRNVFIFAFLHLGALYGIYCCFFCKWQTLLFSYMLYIMGGLGITAGNHRLWAHRTYKARLPLRILLGIFQTLALQNSIYDWSRDHRVHHKHSETHADPHNAKRGLFFSHMGWLLIKKHPEVFRQGAKIPMDDLLADPVVYYQKKYYKTLAVLVCFVLPTVIPVVFWGESLVNAYFVPAVLRYIITLHVTWLVNSVAHFWGWKPYDKRINPVENLFVSIGAIGEGFHNYHHTFPQDYATSEFGAVYFNFTKGFIDFMALIGMAYDRKKCSAEMVLQRRKKTGDLSELANDPQHAHSNEMHEHDY